MADVSVRPAGAEDAGDIARIQIDTWRAAYAEILPPAVLDALDLETVTGAWESAITTPPSPQHRVLVAMEQQWRVGFVAIGPVGRVGPAEDADDDADEGTDGTGEPSAAIAPILVEPRWGRRGHGSRLLAAAADLAREDGTTRLIAWIPERDVVSSAFLTSAGWAPDGLARALDTGAGELREIRMHTSLKD